jgi:hypothetical protein
MKQNISMLERWTFDLSWIYVDFACMIEVTNTHVKMQYRQLKHGTNQEFYNCTEIFSQAFT